MNSARLVAPVMPSMPNPVYTLSVVPTTAPSVNCSVARSHPTTGLAVPSGDGPSCQAPVPDSKSSSDACAPLIVTFASSTQTPSPSVPQSVMTEIETSTFLPA